MDRPWISQYDPGVRATLDYPDLSLPQLFDKTAGRYPERTATVFSDARIIYRDLKRQIDSFAAGLKQVGVQPGDRVAVMLPNVPQFVVAFYGVLRAGAIVVPTNPLYTSHELEHQLCDSGATAIVTLDRFFPSVQAVLPNTEIRTVIVTSVASALPRHLRPIFALKQRRAGIHAVPSGGIVRKFDDLLRVSPLEQPWTTRPDDVAVLQYTGGTTGAAKGAMLTHRSLAANAIQAYEWQKHMAADAHVDVPIFLCATPFFHVYGLTIGMNLAIVSGGTMLLVPRFNAKDVAHIAEKYKPQFFPGVPTMYVALSSCPGISKRHLASLRACISGAAPLTDEVQQRFQTVSGVRIVEGYGLTEASPVTHCNPVAGGGRTGTVGVPFPDTDAMITDPVTWEPLPPGTVGELTVRGPQLMHGYWNCPVETAAVLRDGWLHTGDLAVLEEDGFFRIVDRKKDLVIVSGFNVYPREIEEIILKHPKVNEVAVVGIPDAYQGERVKAVIVLREGTHATAGEIIAFCRRELAPFKVPRTVEFRDELPRTLIGKVLRRRLREEPATEAEASGAGDKQSA